MVSNKNLKKAMVIAGMTSVGVGTAMPVINGLVHADENTTKPNQKIGQPDYKTVDQKINDAKKQGMSIDVKEKTVKVSNKAEFDKAMKDGEQARDKQEKVLDKQIKEFGDWAGSDTGLEGTKPQDIQQELLIKKAPNTKLDLSAVNAKTKATKIEHDDFSNVISGSAGRVVDSQYAYQVQAKEANNAVDGNIATATYTNIDASYGGKKIAKAVYTYKNLEKNNTGNQNAHPTIYIFNDLTDTVWYNNSNGITASVKYYDEQGNEISFKDKTAYFTVGSLNARYSETYSGGKLTKTGPAYHVESVELVKGGTLTKLAGSSIQAHGTKAYADVTNEGNEQTVTDNVVPKAWKGWDNATSPHRIIGAVALNLQGTGQDIHFYTQRENNKSTASTWATLSTTIDPSLPAPTGTFEKTKVVWDIEAPKAPVKAQVDQDGNVVTDNNVKITDKISYGLTAKIPEVDSKGNDIKTVSIVDPLEDVFKFEGGVVKLDNAQGKDITADGTLKFVEGTGVVWTPKDGSKYANKTVYMQLEVSIKENADLSKYEQDGHLVFPNTVYMTVNGEKIPGNEVTVVPAGETTPIVKKVVIDNWEKAIADTKAQALDDAKDESGAFIEKGQKFGYVLDTKIDVLNEKGQLTKTFKVADTLEKGLSLDTVQIVDKTTQTDITKDFEQADKITATLNPEKMTDYRGHQIQVRLGVHVDEKTDLTAYKQTDGSYAIDNVANKAQNETTTESNKVDVKLKAPEQKPEPQLPNTGSKVNDWKIVTLVVGLISTVGSYVYFKKRG